jgi:Na+/phosphate symporter
LRDGNVILVIDDISKEIKQYLINMQVQSLSKDEVLKLAANFDEAEDRQKVLRIVYDEFRREYSSRVP